MQTSVPDTRVVEKVTAADIERWEAERVQESQVADEVFQEELGRLIWKFAEARRNLVSHLSRRPNVGNALKSLGLE